MSDDFNGFGLPMLGDERVQQALQRIGMTDDGKLLAAFLWRAMAIPSVAPDPGALQVEHGRRMIAHHLLNALTPKATPKANETDATGREHRDRKPGWQRARERNRPDAKS